MFKRDLIKLQIWLISRDVGWLYASARFLATADCAVFVVVLYSYYLLCHFCTFYIKLLGWTISLICFSSLIL